jgi:hypothetical protein
MPRGRWCGRMGLANHLRFSFWPWGMGQLGVCGRVGREKYVVVSTYLFGCFPLEG